MRYIYLTVTLIPTLLDPFTLISLKEVVASQTVHHEKILEISPKVTSSRGDPDLLLYLPTIRWCRWNVGSKGKLKVLIIFSPRID